MIALALFAVWDDWERAVGDLPAIAVPVGACLLLFPPRLDVRPTAFALLVIPQLIQTIALGVDMGLGIGWLQGWFPRLSFLAVFAALVFLRWQHVGDARRSGQMLAGAIIATAAALLMPSGASAALVLLALAYTIGSRPLAVVGAVGEVYFLWTFYRDLQELTVDQVDHPDGGRCRAAALLRPGVDGATAEAGAMKVLRSTVLLAARPRSWRSPTGRSCRSARS